MGKEARRLRNAAAKLAALRYIHPDGEAACLRCGEGRLSLLQFHHKDPSAKEATVARMIQNYRWDAFVEELEKCEPICVVCHALEHAQEFTSEEWSKIESKVKTIEQNQRKRYDKAEFFVLYDQGLNFVEISTTTGASFSLVQKMCQAHGRPCQFERRKAKLLPKVLKLKAEGLSAKAIGRRLGVSDCTVGNWLRSSPNPSHIGSNIRRSRSRDRSVL